MKIPVVANQRRTLRHAEFIVVCRVSPYTLRRTSRHSSAGGFSQRVELAKSASGDGRELLFAFELLGNQGR